MALLASGERPLRAAPLLSPFRLAAHWFAGLAAAARRQRAFRELMALDAHRLDDLGVTRTDLFDARRAEPDRRAALLAERRAAAAARRGRAQR